MNYLPYLIKAVCSPSVPRTPSGIIQANNGQISRLAGSHGEKLDGSSLECEALAREAGNIAECEKTGGFLGNGGRERTNSPLENDEGRA